MLTNWEEDPRACRKIQEQKELGQVSLFREISLIFGGGLRFSPSFRTWICKSKGVRNSLTNRQVNAKCRVEIGICVLGRYYTYLDIWVERVISINIKNSSNRFIQALSLSFHISISCLLYMYTRHSSWCLILFWSYQHTHTPISIRHLAFTCLFVREFLTPLDLHVQALKFGLEQSHPPKTKLISRSRPTSRSSFCSWTFLQARGSSSQPVSTFLLYKL